MNREGNKEKKKRNNVMTAGIMIAACLVLVVAGIGAVIGIWNNREEPSPYPVFHKVSSVKIADIPAEKEDGIEGEILDLVDEEKYGVSFEARVLRVFSDPYLTISNAIHGNGSRCYIAELLVKDQIAGDNVPQVVYLILPKWRAEEIHARQTMVYSGVQVGLEGCSYINARTGRIESFGMIFSGYYPDCIYRIYSDENDPAIESAKQTIRFRAGTVIPDSKYSSYSKVLSLANAEGELKQALQEIANPEIGVFRVMANFDVDGERDFWCYRYIDGYQTDEMISIDIETGEVTWSEARYTADDRDNLPNLKKLMRKINTRKLEKPELSQSGAYSTDFYKFQGSYRKVNGEIYGLLGVCWSRVYLTQENGKKVVKNPDPASYKVYTPDGTFVDAKTEQELNSVLGITE